MTVEQLAAAVKAEGKKLNNRLQRLAREGLPATSTAQIETARNTRRKNFVTDSGRVSLSVKGQTEKQLQEKLKFIRGILENTETVKQARENVENKMKQWGTSKQETIRRIMAGRVFAQIQDYSTVFDSEQIRVAISTFSHTPTFDELEAKLYELYGKDMQDFAGERDALYEYMNRTGNIPPGVLAKKNGRGEIQFYEIDQDGNEIFVDY